MKIAYMFSGQGSEYIGMCQELFQNHDTVKDIFEQANNILGYDVSDILFFNEEKLKDTSYTQPLMFVMYVSIVELLKLKSIESTHTMGLSLGEYGALYDSGVISFEQGLRLLKNRGAFMKKACNNVEGSMSAILGLEADILNDIIDKENGYVVIANYNTYGQLVISGEEQAVLNVNEKAKQAGAKRCIPLSVDGPFHSNLMNDARLDFEEVLSSETFSSPNKKLIVNTTGKELSTTVKEELGNQITNSVLFYQGIEECIKDDVDCFIEIGPKKTLSSFVKKVNRKTTILNVEDEESLSKTLLKLEELYEF